MFNVSVTYGKQHGVPIPHCLGAGRWGGRGIIPLQINKVSRNIFKIVVKFIENQNSTLTKMIPFLVINLNVSNTLK